MIFQYCFIGKPLFCHLIRSYVPSSLQPPNLRFLLLLELNVLEPGFLADLLDVVQIELRRCFEIWLILSLFNEILVDRHMRALDECFDEVDVCTLSPRFIEVEELLPHVPINQILRAVQAEGVRTHRRLFFPLNKAIPEKKEREKIAKGLTLLDSVSERGWSLPVAYSARCDEPPKPENLFSFRATQSGNAWRGLRVFGENQRPER